MQGDLISRSAVLDILSNEFDMAAEERAEADNEKDRAFNAGEIHCARRSTRKVKELPAVDAVPAVHAYWKKTYDLIDGHDGYECSACGYTKYFDHYAEGIALCKPYCCNCGARMDGEESEEAHDG